MAKKKKKIDIFNQVDTNEIDLDDVDVKSNAVKLPKPASVRSRRRQDARSGREQKKNKRAKNQTPSGEQVDEFNIPKIIGILPLRNVVVFPGTVTPLAVGRPRSQRLLTELAKRESGSLAGGGLGGEMPGETDRVIGALTQKEPDTDDPDYNDLYRVGTIVTILKKLKLPEGQNSLVVHGLVRFRVVEWLGREPFLKARIEIVEPQVEPGRNLEALVTNVRNMANQMVELSPNIPDEVHVILNNIEEPGALADFLAANINIHVPQKQEILDTFDVNERLRKLSVLLDQGNSHSHSI